ncbi:hypothetical protein PENSPDRAFT_748143 [Peniophora sp. CONT]|nr:hypothetical protein PENSPDRAFT_748143 [Peniophora sp. CONT]
MFCLLSAYWASDGYKLLEAVKDIADGGAENLGLEPILSGDKVSILELVQQALACPILLIGDYVVLWRAYVIFGRPRWLCISTIVIAISYTAGYIALVAYRFQVYGRLMNIIPNFIATVLVAYKAWIHWKDIRTFTHEGGTRHSLALLLVILESGFAYTALTIAYALIVFLNSDGMAANWFAYILTPLLAMYPTLVIVLVSTRKNLLERSVEAASSPSDLRWNVYVPSSKDDAGGRKRNRCTTCRQVGGNISSLGSISELSIRSDLSMESHNASLDSKNEDAGRLTNSFSSGPLGLERPYSR